MGLSALDVPDIAIPLLSVAGIVAWLGVLAKLRYSEADTLTGAGMLVVATLLFGSATVYLGAPLATASFFSIVARIVILGIALVILWRYSTRAR